MMRALRSLPLFFLLCWAAGPSALEAQTSYPMITHLNPVAVQRGKTSEVVVEGAQDFAGVYRVIFEGKGLEAAVVDQPAPKAPAKVTNVKLKINVAADAALGVREFRVVSNLGLSSLGQLVVVDDPVVVEKEDNNTPAKANPLPVPGVACGITLVEDVDTFSFQAQAGRTYTFEVQCARIQDKIHDLQKHADPLLVLLDDAGRELAANDDFYFADPMLSYTAKKTGMHYVQIRDSKYDGDKRWVYALSATDKPYVSHLYPMAGRPGETIDVEPVGSARLMKPKLKLKVPDQPGLHSMTLDVDGVATNPTAFVSSPLPQVLEVEPNDAPAQAQRITLPAGINGRVGQPRDLDHFVFAGKKGQPVQFAVKARRFGTELMSSLDAVLEVLDPTGKVLAGNDDAAGKDPLLVFNPPADGDFIVRLRDLNSKGGDTFVYFIEADLARPDFTLKCDPDKAMIGPGSSMAWYVQVARANGFAGPVQVEVKNLPKGVQASPLTIPPTMTVGLIVLTADADAPRGAENVAIVGSGLLPGPDGKEQKVERSVTPIQEIYSPGGGRAIFAINLQTVAVTDPSDILKVEVKPQEIVLKPGEEVKIDVTIQRRADYQKPVTLEMVLAHLGQVFASPLPPGVTVVPGKSKTAVGTGTTGHIVLKAAPNAAPIERVPISVLAHVSINFVVKVSYSSQPIWVTISK